MSRADRPNRRSAASATGGPAARPVSRRDTPPATAVRGGTRAESTPPAGYWLGGRRPVLNAVRSGRAGRVAVAEGARFEDLLAAAAEQGLRVERLARVEVDRLAGGDAHGCAAWVRPPRAVDLADVLRDVQGLRPCLLVLCDHIQDPHNLGAIARTADAVGAAAVIIPERRAAGVTPAAERASAGALGALPHVVVHNLAWALDQCRQSGFWTYGLAPDGDVDYAAADFADRAVLVVGAEGQGLGALVRRHCDQLIRLPMWGHVESLNASVAAGVLMYAWARQQRAAGVRPGRAGPLTSQ